MREKWLLDGIGSGKEHEEMKKQNQQDQHQTQVLEQSILRYGPHWSTSQIKLLPRREAAGHERNWEVQIQDGIVGNATKMDVMGERCRTGAKRLFLIYADDRWHVFLLCVCICVHVCSGMLIHVEARHKCWHVFLGCFSLCF